MEHSKITIAAATGIILLVALPVFAHDGVVHATPLEAKVHLEARLGSTTVSTDAKTLQLRQKPTASTTVKANAEANAAAKMTRAKQKADQEIDRRVKALNELNTKVQAMVRLSAAQKATVTSSVQSQVSTLTTLKAKIDADTDATVLRADIKSITSSYRIFMLVIPQGRIEVAADKIKTVADLMVTFSAKLQTKISALQTAGKNVTSLNASLADMNAKMADAKVQADAAIALVANLTPDNGDKAKMDANNQALKDARVKIKAGMQDLKTARKDAGDIVKGLVRLGIRVNATSTASTTI